MKTPSPYMAKLIAEQEHIQQAIEETLELYKVVPVGNGFVDLITVKQNFSGLIAKLTSLEIAVSEVSLWCHCVQPKGMFLGCPHGYGGPGNPFGRGWFSELCHSTFRVKDHGVNLDANDVSPNSLVRYCNELVSEYVGNGIQKEPFYSRCLTPGLGLHVPDGWIRRKYYVRSNKKNA
jgi:hypothetical protein